MIINNGESQSSIESRQIGKYEWKKNSEEDHGEAI